jgi:hypothetical protein
MLFKPARRGHDEAAHGFQPEHKDAIGARISAGWVTDITEHPTREEKGVLLRGAGTFSRKVVGWSIDSIQDTKLGAAQRQGRSVHLLGVQSRTARG